MINFYFSTLFVFSTLFIFCQETTRTPLPRQVDSIFADNVLKTIVSTNTKIVDLGEENHGGELTNQINTEIIHTLVTKYGFTTLVFESEIFWLIAFSPLLLTP